MGQHTIEHWLIVYLINRISPINTIVHIIYWFCVFNFNKFKLTKIKIYNFLLVFTMMEKCWDLEGSETFVRMKQVLKIQCYNIFSKFHVFHFYEIVMWEKLLVIYIFCWKKKFTVFDIGKYWFRREKIWFSLHNNLFLNQFTVTIWYTIVYRWCYMCPYTSNKHGCFFMFLPLNTIYTSFKTCTLKLITLKSNFYF